MLVGCRVVAFFVMLGGGLVGLRGSFVVLGGFVMCGLSHGQLLVHLRERRAFQPPVSPIVACIVGGGFTALQTVI
jgi:hypothetical protein